MRIFMITLCVLLAIANIANAETNSWYQVDIIIFQKTATSNFRHEVWSQNPLLMHPKHAVELLPLSPTSPTAFALLANADHILKKEKKKLSDNAAYQVIMHLAWRQMITRRSKRLIHIFGGLAYKQDGQLMVAPHDLPPQKIYVDRTNDVTAAAGGVHDAAHSAQVSTGKVKQWQINGFLRIVKKHYFILRTDLLLTIPTARLNSVQEHMVGAFFSFHLKQAIRMRSNQLYYLDNPMFGMLIKIVPYQAPEAITAPKPGL